MGEGGGDFFRFPLDRIWRGSTSPLLIQGTQVQNRANAPNLTPSVRFWHKYHDQCYSNSSCAECKYQLKNYLQ